MGISKRDLLLSLSLGSLALLLEIFLARSLPSPRSSFGIILFYVYSGMMHGISLFLVLLVYRLIRGGIIPLRAFLYGFIAAVDANFLLALFHIHHAIPVFLLRFLLLSCCAALCLEETKEAD